VTPFTTVTGPAAPLLRPNIDTDVIIRVERLVGTTRAEMGAHAFEVWRRRADGSEDPEFVLNREPFRRAPILLAGIRAVIAPSFSDIFAANALQNGLLPVVLPEATVRRLAAAVERAPSEALVTVDLERCVVVGPEGDVHRFEIDPARREALLAGLDDIGLTLREAGAIAAWQERDRAARPWVWLA
jgi:3-isopropylmalate/(R)-2-methylmalate dehydratase small subunit